MLEQNLKIVNYANTAVPNILHFQGKGYLHYSVLFEHFSNNSISSPQNLSIITCASAPQKSPLIKQLSSSNIPFINAVESNYYVYWVNTLKISYILKSLRSINTDYALILDGYDVAIQSLDSIVSKFLSTNKKILFNATKHNFPRILIDKVPNRDYRGDFCYFNAGCCIGYVKDLIEFYELAYQLLQEEPTNPWNSEQYIIRKAFAHYSEDPNHLVDFDYECKIFQTFGSTKLEKIENNIYKVI